MDESVMLTTADNPYDPWVDFDSWKLWDERQGYFTCEYLARIARTSDDLTEAEEIAIINAAIDEIVKMNVLGIYKKVYPS